MDINDLSVGAFGLAVFMIAIIIPVIMILFSTRIMTRSVRKTIKVFKKK